jgi:signal recognition particle subunit SRP54
MMQVNQLIKQFGEMRKMMRSPGKMKNMMKAMGGPGGMSDMMKGLGGMGGGGGKGGKFPF